MLHRSRKKAGGFVLIVVLGMLVLIIILVVGFLGHVSSQTKTSSSYRDQTGTLLLGDLAVNLVKAQIDAATLASASATPGIWASQPGAIRTIDSSGNQKTYKLYSSATLVDSNTGVTLKSDILGDSTSGTPGDLPLTADPAGLDWSSSGLWTDLNAPAIKSDGVSRAYPIIDVVNDSTDLPTGATSAAPFDTGSFNVDSKPTPTGTNPFAATRVAGTGANAPLPMPVRWLYVLKQGQVIAPDLSSTDTNVTFNNASTKPFSSPANPLTDNPIVGRIAFWTDDDTCRVNVNTASVGTFWDTPRFTSLDDETLANNQPVHKEYQRYPGHQAMTTLTLALPELAGNPEGAIGLTPRYYTGGSTEGTVAQTGTTTALGTPPKTNRLYDSVDELLFDPPPTSTGARTASTKLNIDQVEAAKFFLTAHSRAPELNLFGEPRVAMWPISSTNDSNHRTATDQLIAFCSTTAAPTGLTPPSSTPSIYYFQRAPFTSLDGQGNWAANLTGSNSSPTTTTPSTWDISIARNVNLMSYLDALTSKVLPGNLSGSNTFGGTTSSANNKYTQLGMRQILTEIFDYIRMTNGKDPQLDPYAGGPTGGVPYASYGSPQPFPMPNFGLGQILPSVYTWPTPSSPAQITYGYGRFSGNLVEASLVFFAVGQGIPSGTTTYVPPPAAPATTPPSNYIPVPAAQAQTTSPAYVGVSPAPSGTFSTTIPQPGTTAIQAMLVLSFFDPALGYDQAYTNFSATVSGLFGTGTSGVTLNSTPIGFPSATSANSVQVNSSGDFYGYPNGAGSFLPWQSYLAQKQFLANPATSSTVNSTKLPYFSKIIEVSNTSSTMTLAGLGPIIVSIYPQTADGAGTTASVTPLRTYKLNLASLNGTIPLPGIIPPTSVIYPSGGTGSKLAWPRNLVGSIRTTGKFNSITADRFDATGTGGQPNDFNGQGIGNFLDGTFDTVISMIPSAAYGDYRMLAAFPTALDPANPILAGTAFVAHPAVTSNPSLLLSTRKAYGWELPGGGVYMNSQQGTLVNVSPAYYNGTTSGAAATGLPTTVNPAAKTAIPAVPATVTNPTSGASTAPPDFDNGFAFVPDGPYINKPDEGNIQTVAGLRPYFDVQVLQDFSTNLQIFESPQRQVPSPVMFGSLPTGAPVGKLAAKPWQTLLFQPGMTGHAGLVAPKDEYLLDLFWMPQSEPYAISEPFSTAGKVNLNYQMLPFAYIDRSTAIQSVLASEKVAMVGNTRAAVYKNSNGTNGEDSTFMTTPARFAINTSEVNGTLRQFAQKFSSFDFFHSAAEICDVYLVPQGQTWTSDSAAQSAFYGAGFALVGDNTREKPYADIYSRITTKSNSFTVYYRVQTLKNPPTAGATTWTEGQGAILGDFRGSTTLERYIDPNDKSIPDYTANTTAANLETHYKWRVVENTRFSP